MSLYPTPSIVTITCHKRLTPYLEGEVRELGFTVQDVEVRSPTLQSVFLHLTGRELRE